MLAQDLAEMHGMFAHSCPIFTDMSFAEFAPQLSWYVPPTDEDFGSIQVLCGPGLRSKPKELDRTRINTITTLEMNENYRLGKALFDAVPGMQSYHVLIKRLRSSATGRAHKSSLLQEAALSVGLSHRNLVRVVGVASQIEPTLLMLDHYDGHGSLATCIKSLKLSDGQRISYANDVASAMVYLVEKRIVHRDLRCANLLVDPPTNVKLMLSGLSREVGADGSYLSQSDTVPVRWTAPEGLADGFFTEQSDSWGFGMLLYEIFGDGDVPYGDVLEGQAREMILAGQTPSITAQWPEAVTAVMGQCWGPKEARPRFEELVKATVVHSEAAE